MRTELSKTKTAQVLAAFIRHADEKGSIDHNQKDLFEEIGPLYANGNFLEAHLHELNAAGIIYYEEIGEDGFAPIIMMGVNKRTAEHLITLLRQIEAEMQSLRSRLSEILTFDPDLLREEIQGAEEQLGSARKSAEGSELLKPLLPQIAHIETHLRGVSAVAEKYENIYKNIVRPVQLEGKSGVEATVRWAIISIVASTLVSVLLGNWKELFELLGSVFGG